MGLCRGLTTIATKKSASDAKSIVTLTMSRIVAGRRKSNTVLVKKRKKAAATIIRASCFLLDHAYNDNEERTRAKIPLPISNNSIGSVGELVILN